MAKPRVFMSSTYYDLKFVRDELGRFIDSMGYEVVKFEDGDVPYSVEKPLEESCYDEVGVCDMMVCIIGGNFGTSSESRDGSITKNEVKVAIDNEIPVIFFIENGVYYEYQTYKKNALNSGTNITYHYVNDKKVYEFISEIYSLKRNNPVFPFRAGADIVSILRNQWAGIFHKLLNQNRSASALKVVEEIKAAAHGMRLLVEDYSKDKEKTSNVLQRLMIFDHPLFSALAKVIGVRYRVFFLTQNELESWLSARGYKSVEPKAYDSDSKTEYVNSKEGKYLKFITAFFDEKGNLNEMKQEDWKDEYIALLDVKKNG